MNDDRKLIGFNMLNKMNIRNLFVINITCHLMK